MRARSVVMTLVYLVVAVGACGGELPERHVDPAPAEPQKADQQDVATAACDTEGMPADCDPVAQTGCPGGTACYVIKNIGPACVCPGAVAEGGACNTTSECAPGNACAGTQAPGVCRPYCDPAGPSSCGDGMECIFITAYPDRGFCRPAE